MFEVNGINTYTCCNSICPLVQFVLVTFHCFFEADPNTIFLELVQTVLFS